MEAEILMHWHNRMPSILGSSTDFRDFPVGFADNLLQYFFLVFKVCRRVAGDDDEEAGPLALSLLIRLKTSSSSSLLRGDIAGDHGHIETHQLESDFTFSDLELRLPHFLH